MGNETEDTKNEGGQEQRICHKCDCVPETECAPSYEAKQSIELNEWINFHPMTKMINVLCVDLHWLNQASCARSVK